MTFQETTDQHIDLFRSLVAGKRVCYIDVPIHYNYGDTLIYLGSLELFRKIGVESLTCLSLMQVMTNISLISKSKPDVIVCHGGGNFGDIYESHSKVRKIVVERFPDTPIVFFPQSIFYRSEVNIKRDFELFEKHNNLTMLVRGYQSIDTIKKHSNIDCHLTIDTAHFLYHSPRFINGRTNKKQEGEKLMFFRVDREATSSNNGLDEAAIDWRNFFSDFERKGLFVFRQISKVCSGSAWLSALAMKLWTNYIESKLDKIIPVFANAKCVETDRLHGYILSCLLEVDVRTQDNIYGKIVRYREAFGLQSREAQVALSEQVPSVKA